MPVHRGNDGGKLSAGFITCDTFIAVAISGSGLVCLLLFLRCGDLAGEYSAGAEPIGSARPDGAFSREVRPINALYARGSSPGTKGETRAGAEGKLVGETAAGGSGGGSDGRLIWGMGG
ncbi:hypothetical protein IEQ34_020902 [Dendrobium chrysotoxum]|uniref:Uncharacterized protein n=1 Tax=Dendrobium chrysotoxum TaxID=161865 RepID=A0AAV7FKQ5_DENCH|nr:hypothetical protein IEQ34_020902 [Dendrobium chrysotoxum]